MRLIALLLVLFFVGCTTIEEKSLKLNYGTNEAYNVSGPKIEVSEGGAIKCESDDPAKPCLAQYAAGWEGWENIIKVAVLPFEALLQMFGHTMLPITE